MTDPTVMVATRQGKYWRHDAKTFMTDTEYCEWWLRQHGLIPDIKTARKQHGCVVCPLPILPEQKYYSIVRGGGGLGNLKFPDRIHAFCLKGYTSKQKAKLGGTGG